MHIFNNISTIIDEVQILKIYLNYYRMNCLYNNRTYRQKTRWKAHLVEYRYFCNLTFLNSILSA